MTKDVWAGWDIFMVWLFFSAMFLGIDPDRSIWRERLDRLEKYEAIASSPEALQQALDTYDRIYDAVLACERGIAFRLRHNVVIDCSRIETPSPRLWMAGL